MFYHGYFIHGFASSLSPEMFICSCSSNFDLSPSCHSPSWSFAVASVRTLSWPLIWSWTLHLWQKDLGMMPLLASPRQEWEFGIMILCFSCLYIFLLLKQMLSILLSSAQILTILWKFPILITSAIIILSHFGFKSSHLHRIWLTLKKKNNHTGYLVKLYYARFHSTIFLTKP